MGLVCLNKVDLSIYVVSTLKHLKYGVPQGSVLGPLLFTLYIAPIEDVILKYDLDFMFYADDSDLYVH
jgi:hypothetical protein